MTPPLEHREIQNLCKLRKEKNAILTTFSSASGQRTPSSSKSKIDHRKCTPNWRSEEGDFTESLHEKKRKYSETRREMC